MATMTAAIEKATADITKALENCAIETIKNLPQMQQTMRLAAGMQAMRAALTKQVVEELLMPLMDTPLGFRTDRSPGTREHREKGPYGWDTVRDCAIEAMVRDVRLVGNEMNILANRAYFTRECFERKVREFPGLTNLELYPGVPHDVADKGSLVPFHASWMLDGKPMDLVCDVERSGDGKILRDRRIPVRVNAGMGADAVLGKARRKMLAAIYGRISGSAWMLPEGDAIDTVGEPISDQRAGVASATADLVTKHRAQQAGKNGSETKAPEAETKPASGETNVDDLVKKHRPPSSPSHDVAAGEVAPEDEPPVREPGQEG